MGGADLDVHEHDRMTSGSTAGGRSILFGVKKG